MKVNRDLGRERGSLLQDQVKNGNINTDKVLAPKDIDAINALLRKDQRVELIPTKTGVRVIHIRRDEVKPQ